MDLQRVLPRSAWIACLAAGTLIALLPSSASAATFTWSSRLAVDTSDVQTMQEISCPTATQCTGVNDAGRETTFNPHAVGTPANVTISSGEILRDVSCPGVSQCTAVDFDGEHQITFDPNNPGTPPKRTIDAAAFNPALEAVDCSAIDQCTAVDSAAQEITFNPSSSTTPTQVSTTTVGIPLAINCPTTAQCTAVTNHGEAVTFDPRSGAPAFHVTTIDPDIPSGNNGLQGISCPSASQCTAVDIAGNALTFDPNAATPSPTLDPTGGGSLQDVDCPSATRCVAAEHLGVVEGDPQDKTTWTDTPLTPAATQYGVSCSSVTQCVLSDSIGYARFGAAAGGGEPGGGNPGGGNPGGGSPGGGAPTDDGKGHVQPPGTLLTGFVRGKRPKTLKVNGSGSFTVPGTSASCAPGAQACVLSLDVTGTILVNRFVAFGAKRRVVKLNYGTLKRKLLAGGTLTKIKVTLSAKGRRALAKTKRLKVTIALKLTQGATRKTTTFSITLLAPKPKPKHK